MLIRRHDHDGTFAMFDQLQRQMNRLFGDTGLDRHGEVQAHGASSYEWPRLTVNDAGNELVLRAEVPGLADKDIQLTIDGDVLTLSAERQVTPPAGYKVHRQERATLRFAKSFSLPVEIDAEKADAKLVDGVLTVTLPKAPKAQPRQIAVRA
jgi:HSP20 family protein